jgi:amino acid transporter
VQLNVSGLRPSSRGYGIPHHSQGWCSPGSGTLYNLGKNPCPLGQGECQGHSIGLDCAAGVCVWGLLQPVAAFGGYGPSVYAAAAVLLLTGCNVLGVTPSVWVQAGLSGAKVLGLLLVVLAGLWGTNQAGIAGPEPNHSLNLGLALVFVLFTYGGWNEVAYISAELRQVQRTLPCTLLWGIGLITALYLLVNWAYCGGWGWWAWPNRRRWRRTCCGERWGRGGRW